MDTIISYTVQTKVFRGPFELLLSLIEKRKLLINDISLATVTDDYIEHIKTIQKFPLAQSAHFILIASTLLLIKSKSLLPSLELTREETESIEDLEHRLKEYKKMRELSCHIRELFGKRILFSKQHAGKGEPVFSPDASLSVSSLAHGIRDVFKQLPRVQPIPKVVIEKMMSLEDMVERLTVRITKSLKMSFREFSDMGKAEKITIIISFLAVLELAKQGTISAQQDQCFGDIQLKSQSINVPQYR